MHNILGGSVGMLAWKFFFKLSNGEDTIFRVLKARLHMRFRCNFMFKTCLTLPCMNAFFAKHHVDRKESYHILFEDTLLSNFC